MTNRPNLHPIILLPMGDGNAAFRLASNLKTAWLGSTCQGHNPRRYSLQGHRGTQASGEGWVFFNFCFLLFYFILDPFSVALGSGILKSVPGLFFA